MSAISLAYSIPTSPARGVPSRPTQTTLKIPDFSPRKGSTFTCIPTLSGIRVFNFAPNLLTVTIWVFSAKGWRLASMPEIFTANPIFTRALRRNAGELFVLPMVHLLRWIAGPASGSRNRADPAYEASSILVLFQLAGPTHYSQQQLDAPCFLSPKHSSR